MNTKQNANNQVSDKDSASSSIFGLSPQRFESFPKKRDSPNKTRIVEDSFDQKNGSSSSLSESQNQDHDESENSDSDR